jgi:RNA polymerase sigma factor (sigma-70 family)
MDQSGFRALVVQAQAGDRQAKAHLVDRLRPQVEGAVRRRAGPAHPDQSYHDWVNDVWQRLLRKLGQFQGATEAKDDDEAWQSFQAWLRKIVRSVLANANRHLKCHEPGKPHKKIAIDTVNSSSRSETPALRAKDPSPSKDAISREELRRLGAALEELPESDRELLRLHFYESQTWDQVADALGQTVNQVKYQYRLIRERLQLTRGR